MLCVYLQFRKKSLYLYGIFIAYWNQCVCVFFNMYFVYQI